MTVYVDVLMFINTVVNYLLICVTGVFIHKLQNVWRRLLGSFCAALFSLYIFLPSQPLAIELVMRLLSSCVAVLICFGFHNLRSFLRALSTFFAVSFIYAGLMAGIWMLFEPSKMSVNNGVVYFDISPLLLITASFVFYIVIVVVKKLTSKQAEFAERCSITVYFGQNQVNGTAMVDTGHTLNDGFSESTVMIADKVFAAKLFGKDDTDSMMTVRVPKSPNIAKGFRLIPVNTVSGDRLLTAVRVDKADILCKGKTYRLVKPTVAISEAELNDGYSIIIPPEALSL